MVCWKFNWTINILASGYGLSMSKHLVHRTQTHSLYAVEIYMPTLVHAYAAQSIPSTHTHKIYEYSEKQNQCNAHKWLDEFGVACMGRYTVSVNVYIYAYKFAYCRNNAHTFKSETTTHETTHTTHIIFCCWVMFEHA